MAKNQQERVDLANTQLDKLKSAAKYKIGKILRLNKENIQDQELPQELFLTTRQTTKTRNAFANNISTKQYSANPKIIPSGDFFGSSLANLCKQSINKCCFILLVITY